MQQPLRRTRRKVDSRTAEGGQGEQAREYIYIYDSSDSDTDDEQHPSVMNCGPPIGKQRTRPPVRFSLYSNLDEMVATDRMYGTLEEWQGGDEMALLSIECVSCSKMTETPPCCLECTVRYLGLTINQSGRLGLGCGLFATRNFEIGDVIVPYLGLVSPDRPVQSAYTVQVSQKRYIDATLLRGLGSFVNHSSERGKVNVKARLATFHAEQFPNPNQDGRSYGKGKASFPSVLRMDPFVGFQHYWLVAQRRIDKDTELIINYGTEAGAINRLMHKTMPPFCRGYLHTGPTLVCMSGFK